MIKRISASDYLKRLDNMNGEERQAYIERVGEWLHSNATQCVVCRMSDPGAQLQNVMQASTGWNDRECQAFEEGVVLLTAVIHSEDTWLPDMLYTKAAKRVIRRMTEILKRVSQEDTPARGQEPGSSEKQENVMFTVKPGPHVTVSPDAKSTTTTQAVGEGSQSARDLSPDRMSPDRTELKPVRPKHIDQYVHLLPKKTQERAAQVKDLLHELDASREKMRLLMDDETASAADREAWAKKATAIDNKVRKIYDELDREWDKLVKEGRVVVDDLGNARVVDIPAEEKKPEAEELTPEQKKKRKDLRKWLCDTRYGNGATREDYVKRWKENFKEYAAIEGKAAYEDEKILAAAQHYGIEIKKPKKII